MDQKASSFVQHVTIDEDHHLQRIDNFLFSLLKGLPKSRLYKAIRKGEVRVNKKRVTPDYKLKGGDCVRIPPLRTATVKTQELSPSMRLSKMVRQCVMLEEKDFFILNKPAGVAVHGGSGISFGIIEILRASYPNLKFLELVHRLDRDTSGCLVIAKKSSFLKEVHALLASKAVQKTYWLLAAGECSFEQRTITLPLTKNILKSGERIVIGDPNGKPAKTIFRRIKQIQNMTLLEAKPITGRTHQIRVHAAHMGYPIIGDEKYGNDEANKKAKQLGINQLCLHSASIEFYLDSKDFKVGVCALLKEPWRKYLFSK